jgi:hypothetical protein
VALDENNRSVKRMQSFLTVMPGEVNSCLGCHEERKKSPAAATGKLMAAGRPPSRIEPAAGIPAVFDFTRDIQPILDRHCLPCHDARKRAGGVELTGDRNPLFSMAYYHLMSRMQVFVGGNLGKSSFPPRTLGDAISPLMWKLQGADEDYDLADAFTPDTRKWPRLVKKSVASHQAVKLAPEELLKIRMWVNSGAVYAGTYAALGPSSGIGWMCKTYTLINNIEDLKSVKAAAAVIERRCASCHAKDRAVPTSPVDTLNTVFYSSDYAGYRDTDYLRPAIRTYSRFRVFNLTRPENSLMLLAPLAKAAGGLETCVATTSAAPDAAHAVFSDTRDPDYQALLAAIRDAAQRLDEITLFYKPGFIPNADWLREMKRFGILPGDLDPKKTPVDPYETEQRYWESLWHKPDAREPWGTECPARGQ